MSTVPTLSREDYRARFLESHAAGTVYPLPGGQGTVTVLEDGRGHVHNTLGQSVGVLDPGTTRQLDPNRDDRPPAPVRRPGIFRRLLGGGLTTAG